jgi:hypothetical protein
LRELENKLRQAYINKELYGQLCERRKKEKIREEQVSISSTFYEKLFMLVDPKSVKIQLIHQYLFTLSGSVSVKAVHRMLMKLSPGDVMLLNLILC